MNTNRIVALMTVVCGMMFATQVHALSITASSDGNALANKLLGGGIEISNISYSGADSAGGFFSGGRDPFVTSKGVIAPIGIANGIILSTGRAVDAAGENTIDASTPHGTAGDSNLGPDTYDTAALAFEFISRSGNLYFNFLFASEEFYADSYRNDRIGIFIDGINIAGFDSVDTAASSGCRDNFGDYYVRYNGLTAPMTANITGLSSGTHTLKFAVADIGDDLFDSALFVEAGSLSADPVPEPSTIILLSIGLAGICCMARRG